MLGIVRGTYNSCPEIELDVCTNAPFQGDMTFGHPLHVEAAWALMQAMLQGTSLLYKRVGLALLGATQSLSA